MMEVPSLEVFKRHVNIALRDIFWWYCVRMVVKTLKIFAG